MSMNANVSYLPGARPAATAVASKQSEILRVFERQRDTALRLRTSTAEERAAKIRKLKAAVLAATPDFYDAGMRDFKKPAAEVDLTEILPIVAEANDALRHLRRWTKPQRVFPTMMMFGTQAWVQHEARGRCLIISPWNYPANLTLGPLVSALAAGNTVILKPSEMTPHTTAVMVRLIRELFSEDEVAIFDGDASVSTTLLELPFDHIFFTGSPAIGKVVMAAAARHLTSVTLELGGKSPTIVDETADLKAAAKNILWGKYTNNGQTCIAPDHIYVHNSVKDEFIRLCREVLSSSYGDTQQAQMASPYLARVVNTRHTQRLAGLLSDAASRGAKVLSGGTVSEADCFVAPTLLTDIPADAKIMSEEIFGPLLPIIGYGDLDRVIAEINGAPKPLALYIWSRKEANINALLKRTSAGGTCINHSVVQFIHGRLPFGGVNNSGIGSAHGLYGFKAFSHERAVVRNRYQLAALFYPPYTNFTRRVGALLLKLV
ncbi:MAG: aldehyde dehydrogenase family protein [Hydrocarboniphaga sp.]|uniref:aldehyde dehydrogenase family protein n=1 Tax=Hydrocarboniphaga sp. TaxID=2033016 RepID=UPI00280F59C4|nr:aldehyde dehydrogenase family protein [Hydrocarboniphaga sp.]